MNLAVATRDSGCFKTYRALLKFARKHKGALLLAIGNLIFAGMGFYSDIRSQGLAWFKDTSEGNIFIGASAIVLLGSFWEVRRSDDINDFQNLVDDLKEEKSLLEDENAEMIRPSDLSTIVLENLVKDLEFSDTERFTLFYYV